MNGCIIIVEYHIIESEGKHMEKYKVWYKTAEIAQFVITEAEDEERAEKAALRILTSQGVRNIVVVKIEKV